MMEDLTTYFVSQLSRSKTSEVGGLYHPSDLLSAWAPARQSDRRVKGDVLTGDTGVRGCDRLLYNHFDQPVDGMERPMSSKKLSVWGESMSPHFHQQIPICIVHADCSSSPVFENKKNRHLDLTSSCFRSSSLWHTIRLDFYNNRFRVGSIIGLLGKCMCWCSGQE